MLSPIGDHTVFCIEGANLPVAASTFEGQSSPSDSRLCAPRADSLEGSGKPTISFAAKERIARNKAAAMAKRAVRAKRPIWHIKTMTDAHFGIGDTIKDGGPNSEQLSSASSSSFLFANDAPVIASFANSIVSDSAIGILPPCKRAKHSLLTEATPTTEVPHLIVTRHAEQHSSLAPVANSSVAACGFNAPT